MTGRSLLAVLVLAASPFAALADTTVRAHEGGVRDGKAWGESYTEYHSSHGLRIDVTTDGESSPGMSFLFLRQPDRVYILQGGSATLFDLGRIQAMEADATPPPPAPAPRIVALETKRTVEGFACSDFELSREGQPVRSLCLAPARSLGLPAAFVADMQGLQGLMSRIVTAVERSQGKPPTAFNLYSLAEGYPVRAWETSDGKITWESQLLSVKDGALSPEHFRAPDVPK